MTQGRDQTQGRYTVFEVAGGLWLPRFSKRNCNQKEGGAVLAQLLQGRREYKIGAVYFEFANVATPGDTVTVPEIDAGDGRAYYDGLGVDTDYLRVELTIPPTIRPTSGEEALFEEGHGNEAEFYAISEGESGVHGLPFGYGANSVIYGMALVATPDWGDRTKDLVFARGYYDVDNQIPKSASKQVSVRWVQSLGPQG